MSKAMTPKLCAQLAWLVWLDALELAGSEREHRLMLARHWARRARDGGFPSNRTEAFA